MAYDEAFYYVVVGIAVVVITDVASFVWRATRRAKAGGHDGDGR